MVSDTLYRAFGAHVAACQQCTPQGECPEGAQLLKAYVEQWAREDAAEYRPEAVHGVWDDDDRPGEL